MRRILLILLGALLSAWILPAQVLFSGGNTKQMSRLSLTVLDSLSREPVPYVSVYIQEKGDSVITNFTLSDTKGQASIRKIPFGPYIIKAELMGYRTWVKEIYFREPDIQLGEVLLQEDTQLLEAARVTDIGSPMRLSGDTLVFQASSFQLGANDMLEDLLRRMPGMEVATDGSVKMNGEKITRITVGGKTFFFDDPATAVKSLPAVIVEKIKVFDKQSKEAEFTGIEDQNKEKVMDISMKKEYRKGWFGNARALAGASDEEFLYNAQALVAGYTERDQLTLVGNLYNAPENPGTLLFSSVEGDADTRTNAQDGRTKAFQSGVNLNTERLKGFESTLSLNWKGLDRDQGSQTSRTTFRESQPDLLTQQESQQFSGARTLSVGLELEKEEKKRFSLDFDPSFRWTRNWSDSQQSGSSQSDGVLLNRSEATVRACSDVLSLGGSLTAGIKQLGNKEKRSLTLSLSPSLGQEKGWSTNATTTTYASGTEVRQLHYDSRTQNKGISASLGYVEPFAEYWAFRVRAQSHFNARDYSRVASDDYYSSLSQSEYWRNSASLLLQFNRKPFNIQAGFEGMLTRNETFSRAYGVETRTGMGEWLLDWSPSINARYRYKGEYHSWSTGLRYNGASSQPSAQRMLPALDVSQPTRISAGNIYLKPSFTQTLQLNADFSNIQSYLYGYATASLSVVSRAQVNASWYDSDGKQYSIPVNARSPRVNFSSSLSGNLPLESSKRLTLNGSVQLNLSRMTSYQNTSAREGIDPDSFDYGLFMQEFWGNKDGDRFYGGQSGFSPSATRTLRLGLSTALQYKAEQWHAGILGSAIHRQSRYSLSSRSNTAVWDFRTGGSFTYTTKNDWEFNTTLQYLFYRGYADGYGQSELRWNLGISKNVGAFSFLLNGFDLLGQSRNLVHTVSDDYTEDEYTRILGRYFLIGVKWHFGSMSSAQSKRANRASMNMML